MYIEHVTYNVPYQGTDNLCHISYFLNIVISLNNMIFNATHNILKWCWSYHKNMPPDGVFHFLVLAMVISNYFFSLEQLYTGAINQTFTNVMW